MSAQKTNFAVCRQVDGLVLNIIVASQGDRCPILDCELIEVPDGVQCSIGYFWNGIEFIDPTPPTDPVPPDEGSFNAV